MGEWWKAFGVAFLFAVSAFGANQLGAQFGWSNWTEALAGSFAAALLISAANHYSILRRVSFVRRRVYKVARYEGLWVSQVDNPARPFSVSKIYLSPYRNVWKWRGVGFDTGGREAVTWKARSIHYDHSEGEWFFRGHWTAFDAGSEGHASRSASRDQLILVNCSSKRTDTMSAVVIDDVYDTPASRFVGAETMRHLVRVNMYRLDQDLARQIIGRRLRFIEELTIDEARKVASWYAMKGQFDGAERERARHADLFSFPRR